jgi:hypothetical protein
MSADTRGRCLGFVPYAIGAITRVQWCPGKANAGQLVTNPYKFDC